MECIVLLQPTWLHRNKSSTSLYLSIYLSLTSSSTPAVPKCCCSKGSAPYWSNQPFLIFDIRALWRSGLSARAPECQKLKMVGSTSMTKCKALTGSAVKGLRVSLALCTSRDKGTCPCAGPPLLSARQHPSYGDCLEVKWEYCQNSSVPDCVTQCSQSTACLLYTSDAADE